VGVLVPIRYLIAVVVRGIATIRTCCYGSVLSMVSMESAIEQGTPAPQRCHILFVDDTPPVGGHVKKQGGTAADGGQVDFEKFLRRLYQRILRWMIEPARSYRGVYFRGYPVGAFL